MDRKYNMYLLTYTIILQKSTMKLRIVNKKHVAQTMLEVNSRGMEGLRASYPLVFFFKLTYTFFISIKKNLFINYLKLLEFY